MDTTTRLSRRQLVALASLAALVTGVVAGDVLTSPRPLDAAYVEGNGTAEVLIGKDDDNLDNLVIQPPGTVANQSLNNTDILDGEGGNDVLIGLLGNDVLLGGGGRDILIGGTEQGTQPNSDVIFGGGNDDVNIWAPGDGSDAFDGGPGTDALIFGGIDRDVNNVPTLTGTAAGFPHGIPTADVSGLNNFCRVDAAPPDSGYDFLVRFLGRAAGNIIVTIRTKDVEQAFCPGQNPGEIAFADLTQASPQFVTVSLDQVETLNRLVRRIIR